MSLFSHLRRKRSLVAEIETLTAANRKLTEERDTAQLVSWMRCPPALRAELEALRAENARLRYNLTTAWLASWVKHREPSSRSRSEPHPVRPGRHRQDAPVTELHPRAGARREATK